MAALAFVEPENPLCTEHLLGHLVVKKVLETSQRKGTFALKRQGGEAFNGQMIGMILMAVAVTAVVVPVMAVVVAAVIVPVMAVVVPLSLIHI